MSSNVCSYQKVLDEIGEIQPPDILSDLPHSGIDSRRNLDHVTLTIFREHSKGNKDETSQINFELGSQDQRPGLCLRNMHMGVSNFERASIGCNLQDSRPGRRVAMLPRHKDAFFRGKLWPRSSSADESDSESMIDGGTLNMLLKTMFIFLLTEITCLSSPRLLHILPLTLQ